MINFHDQTMARALFLFIWYVKSVWKGETQTLILSLYIYKHCTIWFTGDRDIIEWSQYIYFIYEWGQVFNYASTKHRFFFLSATKIHSIIFCMRYFHPCRLFMKGTTHDTISDRFMSHISNCFMSMRQKRPVKVMLALGYLRDQKFTILMDQ